MARKLTYLIACTAEGFIAEENGNFDFFPTSGEHLPYLFTEYPETIPAHLREVLGVRGSNRHFDTVLMGRRTYEVGLAFGVTNPYPHLKQYVISRSLPASPDPAVELVPDDPLGTVRSLKSGDGLDIWLCGGAELATAVFAEIDEVVLKVNPVVLGSGIPLFTRAVGPAELELLDSQVFGGGVIINRYRVKR